MAKQTYTTGQVLTAAQMTSLQQTAMLGGSASAKVASYTLVAADAGTSVSMSNASATTITVNTALFAAGDTVTILNIGVGTCTITAGTATVSKPTNATLALVTSAGGVLFFTATGAATFMPFDVGAAAATSTKNFALLNSPSGTALTGATTVTVSSIGGYDQYYVLISGASAGSSANIYLRLNTDTGSNYNLFGYVFNMDATYASGIMEPVNLTSQNKYRLAAQGGNTAGTVSGGFTIAGANTSGQKMITANGGGIAFGFNGHSAASTVGFYNSATVITSISAFSDIGNFDAGTMFIYGAV